MWSKCLEADFVFFIAFDVGNSKYLIDNDLNNVFINNDVNIMSNTLHILSILQKPFIIVSNQMANFKDIRYRLLKKLGEEYTRALKAVLFGIGMFMGVNSIQKIPCYHWLKKAKTFNHIRIKSNEQEERQFLFIDNSINCLVLSQKFNDINRKEILEVTFLP